MSRANDPTTRELATGATDTAGATAPARAANAPDAALGIDPATADRYQVLGEAALRMVDMEVNRQAAMIAYLDDFQLMMWGLVLFMPLILLMRPPKGPPGQLPHPVGE